MKYWLWTLLASILILLAIIGTYVSFASAEQTNAPAVLDKQILLDPGHGGEDGGTAATDGTLEKNINLAVALNLRDMLRVCGYPVSMTRDTDISIHKADCVSAREKKVSDMHNRLTLYNQSALVISIHQNHFSASKYDGAQVFYSGNVAQSKDLAQSVQQRIVQELQPDNTRQIKKATDGIYLLYHALPPAILVECGFLSNPEECNKLCTPSYQQAMAGAVFAGLLDYWTITNEK